MKISTLFGQTSKESPANSEYLSHQFLVRGGFIRQISTGIYSYLHLAHRTIKKIECIIREEMDRIGGQEISMPVVHPAELWKTTGRWYSIGSELGRFVDKNTHDMVLAMTNEEVVAELVRRDVNSYKQLPKLIYQIQLKWRDDPRPRAGLIRVREFTMLDSYSLDIDEQGLDKQYRAHFQAYFNIFRRVGLPVKAIKSDAGMMGGKISHEFMYETPIGEDTIITCNSCGYIANRQIAQCHKVPNETETLSPIAKIKTPSCKTIEHLARFLNIPESKTAKALLFIAFIPENQEISEYFIFAMIRGDMDLNVTKLKNVLQAREIRPATEEEIIKIGAVPGYASPIDLHPQDSLQDERDKILIVIDDSIVSSPNLVAGANIPEYHLLNTNYLRDYQADYIADVTDVDESCFCPTCISPLQSSKGIEVGNIFQLGTLYSDTIGCTFVDRKGEQQSVVMGSYGIGIGRLLACIAEEHNDDQGLIWPISVAPYQVHLILISDKSDLSVDNIANNMYFSLLDAGIEILYDDRKDKTPGEKFMDADLIGIPIRITISKRTLRSGTIEIKIRGEKENIYILLTSVVDNVKRLITKLKTDIEDDLIPVEYPN